jgi:hypothetical protein
LALFSEESREIFRRPRDGVGPGDAAGVEAEPERFGAQER